MNEEMNYLASAFIAGVFCVASIYYGAPVWATSMFGFAAIGILVITFSKRPQE